MDTWLNEKDKEHYRTNGIFMKKKIKAHINKHFHLPKPKKKLSKKTKIGICPQCKKETTLIKDGSDRLICSPCYISSLG